MLSLMMSQLLFCSLLLNDEVNLGREKGLPLDYMEVISIFLIRLTTPLFDDDLLKDVKDIEEVDEMTSKIQDKKRPADRKKN